MDTVARQLAQQQLQEIESHIRLLIMHPNYRFQHMLLSTLLETDDCVYVRLDGEDLSRKEITSAIEDALFTQAATHNLHEIKRLILDEWDRAQPAELEIVLKKLIPDVGNGHIILMGRGMPKFMHQPSELQKQARFIPIHQASLLMDYQQREDRNILLEVYSLGSGTVKVNGRPILDWGGDLPRSLFFYLIDRGIATRNDIFQAFWPNMTVREATNVFHVTKRKVSELLGTDLTIYWSGFYRISQQIELIYDVALFGEAVQNSPVALDGESENLLAQAIEYYRGDYLASADGTIPWVHKRRTELRQTYSESLINLARITEQSGDLRKALGYYIRAYATNPQREDVAGNIMKVYAELGFAADALAIYNRLETELMDNLNISPAQWIQKLAMDIRTKANAAVYTV